MINGEKLSGHEKDTPMFSLLHSFWAQIKEENLQASKIFTMLNKVKITLIETDDVPIRDLYYNLSSEFKLNQISLIDDYMKELKLLDDWTSLKKMF